MNTIIVERHDRVCLVRLNRPQALNALNAELIDELNQALDAFEADAELGCLVLTGSDKAFAAGADVKEMQAKTYMEAYLEDFISKWERLTRTRKPVIAAVAGFAPAAPSVLPVSWANPRPWSYASRAA